MHVCGTGKTWGIAVVSGVLYQNTPAQLSQISDLGLWMHQGGLRKVKSAEKLLDDVLSWHSLDEQKSTLVVTVLEARGMQPRKGGRTPPEQLFLRGAQASFMEM